jgi:hypothetical protein
MKWENLKKMLCPKCGAHLINYGNKIIHEALPPCDFRISFDKFNQVVNNLYNKKPIQDNFQELQNLGHEEVSEDFSDSPALNY